MPRHQSLRCSRLALRGFAKWPIWAWASPWIGATTAAWPAAAASGRGCGCGCGCTGLERSPHPTWPVCSSISLSIVCSVQSAWPSWYSLVGMARSPRPSQHGPVGIARSEWPGRDGPVGMARSACPGQRAPVGMVRSACPGRHAPVGMARVDGIDHQVHRAHRRW